jgi:hypothetical protein
MSRPTAGLPELNIATLPSSLNAVCRREEALARDVQ